MPTDTRHRTYDEVLGLYAEMDNEGRLDEPDEVLHPDHTVYGALGAHEPQDLEERAAGRIRTAFPHPPFVPADVSSKVIGDDTPVTGRDSSPRATDRCSGYRRPGTSSTSPGRGSRGGRTGRSSRNGTICTSRRCSSRTTRYRTTAPNPPGSARPGGDP